MDHTFTTPTPTLTGGFPHPNSTLTITLTRDEILILAVWDQTQKRDRTPEMIETYQRFKQILWAHI